MGGPPDAPPPASEPVAPSVSQPRRAPLRACAAAFVALLSPTPPALVVTDTYTDTTGVSLASHVSDSGGTWSAHPATPSATASIQSNRVRGTAAVNNYWVYSVNPDSPDQDVSITAVVQASYTAQRLGVFARFDPTTASGYTADADADSEDWTLTRWTNGIGQSLGSYSGATFDGSSKKITLSCVGSTIRLLIDDVAVVTATDATYAAAGRWGVHAYNSSGTSSGVHGDNFIAATSPVPESAQPPPPGFWPARPRGPARTAAPAYAARTSLTPPDSPAAPQDPVFAGGPTRPVAGPARRDGGFVVRPPLDALAAQEPAFPATLPQPQGPRRLPPGQYQAARQTPPLDPPAVAYPTGRRRPANYLFRREYQAPPWPVGGVVLEAPPAVQDPVAAPSCEGVRAPRRAAPGQYQASRSAPPLDPPGQEPAAPSVSRPRRDPPRAAAHAYRVVASATPGDNPATEPVPAPHAPNGRGPKLAAATAYRAPISPTPLDEPAPPPQEVPLPIDVKAPPRAARRAVQDAYWSKLADPPLEAGVPPVNLTPALPTQVLPQRPRAPRRAAEWAYRGVVSEARRDPGVLGGGYRIYANSGTNNPIDYEVPVATTDLLTWTSGPLAYPGTWKFGVRAASHGTGQEEKNLDCMVTLVLDNSGNDVTGRPLAPTGLTATPARAGKVRVSWRYPTLTASGVTGFRVYWGVGAPDYSTPAATVAVSNQVGGVWVAELSGTDGVTYTIGVRAYNATAEEPNTLTVTATADSAGPAAVQNLLVTSTDVAQVD